MRPFRLSDCDVENTSEQIAPANEHPRGLGGIHQIHGSASFNTTSSTTQHYEEEGDGLLFLSLSLSVWGWMAIAETALPGRLLSIQLWGVTIRLGRGKK